MVNRRHLGIFALLLGGILLFTTPAFAEAGSGEVSIEILPSLTLTLSGDSLSISNLAAETLTNSNSLSATVVTNSQTGYTLSASAGTTDNATTNLINTNASTYFSTLASGSFTASTFTNDSWGISTDNGSTYRGLPLYTADPLSINSSESPATATTNFLIGAKASDTMTSGDYTNIITLTAITNPEPKTLATITYMQEMTSDICASAPTPLATDGADTPQYKLIDNRDNKEYWVAKLADGKCWMTQNLDLDLSPAKTLTNEDTDLNSIASWTPERRTFQEKDVGTSNTWADNNNKPYSFDPKDVYYYTSDYQNYQDIAYSSLSACTKAGHSQDICKHYHAGNYYNWTAAIASNNSSGLTTQYQDAPNSICPKGWRLWKANHNESEAGEMSNMLYAYNLMENPITVTNGYLRWTTYDDALYNALRNAPLFTNRSGYIAAGTQPGYMTTNGGFWSSTINTSARAYLMSVYTETGYSHSWNVYPQGYDQRNIGYSVRCVAR